MISIEAFLDEFEKIAGIPTGLKNLSEEVLRKHPSLLARKKMHELGREFKPTAGMDLKARLKGHVPGPLGKHGRLAEEMRYRIMEKVRAPLKRPS